MLLLCVQQCVTNALLEEHKSIKALRIQNWPLILAVSALSILFFAFQPCLEDEEEEYGEEVDKSRQPSNVE